MKGGKNRQPLGYTIVEVMVVLAVSGVMFVIAASFINGKQQRSAFTAGVNDMASQLQDVVEQVTDGKYSDIPLNCSTAGGPIQFLTGARQQGHNQDCVFIGKFLHFDISGNNSDYETFSLAGARTATDLSGVTPITPYAPGGGGYELTTQASTPQSLDAKIILNGTTQIYGFGFTQSVGTTVPIDGGKTGYVSGAQNVSLVYAQNLGAGADEQAAANAIVSSPGLVSANSIAVCLTDGTRYAEILLGGADTSGNQQSQLTANVQQLGNTAC